MTIVLLANGILSGLSGDTKPTGTTYPTGTLFFETNTGSMFYYNGTTWAAIAGGGGGGITASSADTLTNKAMDAATNTFTNIRQFPHLTKSGAWWGVGATTGDGLLDTGVNTSIAVAPGVANAIQSSSIGTRFRWQTTGLNGIVGVRSARAFERDLNTIIQGKLLISATTSIRAFFGFAGSVTNPTSTADPLANISGVGFWFDDATDATNWHIMQNDGSASSDKTTISSAGAASTAATVFAIRADNTNSKFQYSFNGGTWTDINTKIPAASATLALYIQAEGTTATSRNLDIFYAYVKQDS